MHFQLAPLKPYKFKKWQRAAPLQIILPCVHFSHTGNFQFLMVINFVLNLTQFHQILTLLERVIVSEASDTYYVVKWQQSG